MFKKILIANRGEIACRIIKTLKRMNIISVTVFSRADKNALHVKLADEAYELPGLSDSDGYLNGKAIVQIALANAVEAVHPGYGFLSENAEFAGLVESKNLKFIGPPVTAIKIMGDKILSKKQAVKSDVSVIPGDLEIIPDLSSALKKASIIGFPIMIKASAGGGGKGMRVAYNEKEVEMNFQTARNEAGSSFGDDRVFLEKFITEPRHIEVQILGDFKGNYIHLGERECSIQRRNQKVIEEAPSLFLKEETRESMFNEAIALARSVEYYSLGTVEFIVDKNQEFYFLEMNTRLQVEHPVTELITGIDLVEEMIRVANGETLRLKQSEVRFKGWALESRVYAEDTSKNFLPSTGRITRFSPPNDLNSDLFVVRNDTGVMEGNEISIYYDPMISKLCVWASDREQAIRKMQDSLDKFEIEGVKTNLSFLSAIFEEAEFSTGDFTTAFIQNNYPDGFKEYVPGLQTKSFLLALVSYLTFVKDYEMTNILERDNQDSLDLILHLDTERFPVKICVKDCSGVVVFSDGSEIIVTTNWFFGRRVIWANFGEKEIIVKVKELTDGFKISYRGSDFSAKVYTPRISSLVDILPAKMRVESTNTLVAPMPGLLVSVDVHEGTKVEVGQRLCSLEAMKMENVLYANQSAVIKRINYEVGISLALNDIIIEFE